MKNNTPLVSVVIIAYNEEKYISAAIESVLKQTYEKIELIIVDDGSSDDTVSIARQYEPKVKVISQKNSGGCSSPRNTGLRYSSGHYTAFLDADDILVPEKIAMQVDLFLRNESVGMVIGNYQNFSGTEKYNDHFSTCPKLLKIFEKSDFSYVFFNKGEAASLLISENFSIAGSPLYLRSALLEIDGFDEKLLACEDFHLIYRMAQRCPIAVDNRVIFFRRLHLSNMSSNQLKMKRYYCHSRIDLLSHEQNYQRRIDLSLCVGSHLRSYFRHVLRAGAVGHVGHLLSLSIKYFLLRIK